MGTADATLVLVTATFSESTPITVGLVDRLYVGKDGMSLLRVRAST